MTDEEANEWPEVVDDVVQERGFIGRQLHVDDAGNEWLVEVGWNVVRGRLVPVSFHVHARRGEHALPVTRSVLKGIPVARIQQAMRTRFISRAEDLIGLIDARGWNPEWKELPEYLLGTARGPQRGKPLTDEDLEAVAAVYKAASEAGEPVNSAVKEAFSISGSTAGKRIMAARGAGLLDDYPTKGGIK